MRPSPSPPEAENDANNQLNAQGKMKADKAMDIAWTNMKVRHPLVAAPKSDMVWVAVGEGFQLAHKVEIAAQMPTGGFVQYLHAESGALLDSYTTSLPRMKEHERTVAARGALSGATLDRQAETDAVMQKIGAQAKGVATTAAVTAAAAPCRASTAPAWCLIGYPRTALNTDGLTDTLGGFRL